MLYIHIGSPKTGTTSVQHFFAEHAPSLLANGLLYPDIGLGQRGKHHALKVELKHPKGGPLWETLRRLRSTRPDTNILVSEESFYHLEAAELARLPAAVGPGPVTIVVYFRDYASHAASLYAQGMKLARGLDDGDALGTKCGNELLDFDAFFERYMAKPSHFEVVSRWAAIFGWSAILVRPYRRDLLVGGDIIDDLLDVVGLSVDRLGVPRTASTNHAPGWKTLETLRAVWRALERAPGGLEDGRIPNKLRNLCREVVETAITEDPRTEYLTLAQRQRCAEATARDVASLNAHLPAPGFNYPPAPLSGERPFAPCVDAVPSADLAAVVAHLALRAVAAPVKARKGKALASAEERAARKAARLGARGGKHRPTARSAELSQTA